MARLISRAEAYEKAYEAFSQINFNAFDYTSVKQSIVDYIKLYFPESFNDFIESSEFVAIVEVFAYLGELLIYRVDVSSHENFISVAQRKQSVLRLAKLISYRTTRNLPARGLLKITSLTSTEDLFDTRGNSLKGRLVAWNDVNNAIWKEQFLTVLNAASVTNIGTVTPKDRVQVDNVLFELYALNNIQPVRGVIPYNIDVNGETYDMEVVPVRIDQYGPVESRPENGAGFTFLYGADGFGNDSPTTGFFLFTKQGSLRSFRQSFDGKTPNQYTDLPSSNINDTDLWINAIDPISEEITNDGSIRNKRSGEWDEVDTTSAQNVIFSYSSGRNRYETETLENDQVRVVFGDGEFSNIPNGLFEFWYRVSANQNVNIPLNAVIDKSFVLKYVDKLGQPQTLQITASLISNVQNAAASEDIEHIRRVAPSNYYTQNRMVNAADYNLYPLKDPSILKLRTINRTYIGESKFSHWHDSSNTYENVKIVGDDLSVLFEDYTEAVHIAEAISTQKVYLNYIVPILSTVGLYTYLFSRHIPTIRRSFTTAESFQIQQLLANNVWPSPIYILYDAKKDLFTAVTVTDEKHLIKVDATVIGGQIVGWVVTNRATKIHAESPTTMFWSANGNSEISYDTLTPQRDKIIILKANPNKYDNGILSGNVTLAVSNVVPNEVTGLQDINRLEVIAYDTTNSYISGINLLGELIDPVYYIYNTAAGTQLSIAAPTDLSSDVVLGPVTLVLPPEFAYVKGMEEFTFPGLLPTGWKEDPTVAPGEISRTVIITADTTYPIQIRFTSYVYHYRPTVATPFSIIRTTDLVRQSYAAEVLAGVVPAKAKFNRLHGRSGMNFMWRHTTKMFHLVDPSPTNINDAFVVQKGYYNNLQSWLAGNGVEPALPTALQLRNDYKDLLVNAMISDAVIFHPGKLKLVFGDKAIRQLRATLLVVKNPHTQLTDSQIKVKVRDVTRDFFDITYWEFGETFYFTELAAVIHKALASDINSVVLVPLNPDHFFGDLFQVNMSEDEIVQADINTEDITIATSLNAVNTNQFR